MNPAKIPELLQEIAACVEDPAHLARLITLDSVESLATALSSDPKRAALLRSLSFCEHACRTVRGVGDSEDLALHQLYDDLITIFDAISQQSQLTSLKWHGDTCQYRGEWMEFPAEVWTAISGALIQVQELDIFVGEDEEHIWCSIIHTPLPALRVFKLSLLYGHGWDCAHLQTFLDALPDMEDLTLTLPTTIQMRIHILKPTTRPVDRSLSSSAVVVHHPITHLRLRDMPHLSQDMVPNAIRASSRTLCCLELDQRDKYSFRTLVTHIASVLTHAPTLHELGIINCSSYPHWNPEDLTAVLKALETCGQLVALRFGAHSKTGSLLPQALLDDLGSLPPRLRYMSGTLPPAAYGSHFQAPLVTNNPRAVSRKSFLPSPATLAAHHIGHAPYALHPTHPAAPEISLAVADTDARCRGVGQAQRALTPGISSAVPPRPVSVRVKISRNARTRL
ncbi:hypothetical protein C8R44DRAFT_974322 [Mycena epipterygia]|nr:hypothetical protein C8R44DRAFT_974322 [Mycena epipterygia]